MQQVITWRGRRFNQRTIDMLQAVERICGFPLVLAQGSYNKGVTQSAGTHDGGGAVDIDVEAYSPAKRLIVVRATRMVGFASWLRTPAQGKWKHHVHCEAVGDPDLSPQARTQVQAYENGFNGLASNGKDDGPRDWVGVTWEKYRAAQEEFTVSQFQDLIDETKRQGDATRQEVRRQAIWAMRYGVQTEDERIRADAAFDEVIEKGGTLKEALAALQAVMKPIADDLEKRAKANG
ncbi:MAG: hypothetical protein HOV78_05105 [Hamadaea sp.]|nr:hypothetical protein [Hamadaea sp.]